MPTSISRFPLEVGQHVFDIVLFSDCKFSYSKFIKDRYIICRASSEWMRVLRACPEFWSQLYITTFTPEHLVETFVERAKQRSLRLCFAFYNMHSYRAEYGAEDNEVYDLVVDRFRLVAPYMARTVKLFVETDDSETMAVVEAVCQTLAAPALREAVFRLTYFPSGATPAQPYRPLVRSWFNGSNTALQTLHVYQMPFSSWTTGCSALRHLRLFNIGPALTVAEFSKAISGSPQLEELALYNIYLSTPISVNIASKSLRTLRVGGTGTTRRIIAHLDLPKVKSLFISIASNQDVGDARACSGLLGQITHLTVYDHGRDIEDFTDLYHHIVMVSHLDFTKCSRERFDQLVQYSTRNVDGVHTTVLPLLATITLPAVNALAIKRFCQLHGASNDSNRSDILLQKVIAADRSGRRDQWDEDTFRWVGDHVTMFERDYGFRRDVVDHEQLGLSCTI
ncbi:hypothetical protein DFH06DRAFT_1346790 [Mycena polygramma]|nr:hypothetical protein DFH06DRAFT_1346790 [Mycena polygramma]